MDGFNEVTSGQRERVAELTSRLRAVSEAIATMRRDTSNDEALLQISLLQNSVSDVVELMGSADTIEDIELDMLLDDVAFELDQLQERVERLGGSMPSGGGGTGGTSGLWIIGGAIVAVGAFLFWQSRQPAF